MFFNIINFFFNYVFIYCLSKGENIYEENFKDNCIIE